MHAPGEVLEPEEQQDALGGGQDGQPVGGDGQAAQVHHHHRNLCREQKVGSLEEPIAMITRTACLLYSR